MDKAYLLIGYAKLGYRLHPLKPGTKQPLLQDWPHKASAEEHTIRHWQNHWPHCNWGIVTGEGFSVLDIDPAALVAGWPGEKRQRNLKATRCPLAQTPRGGFHLYFKADWPNTTGKIAPGVDTKGQGGYIVVPPSTLDATAYKEPVELINGGAYRWIRPLMPVDQLPPPPPWLDEAVKAASRQAEPKTTDSDALAQKALRDCETLPEGQRNDGLTRLAGKLRRLGLSQPELEAALLEANRCRCVPPLPEREVLAIARSVSRYPAGSVKGLETMSTAMQRQWDRVLKKLSKPKKGSRHDRLQP